MSNSIFKQKITTEHELRDLLGYPSDLVLNKTINSIDKHCRNFIAQSSMVFISTADVKGACDVSPRGDEAGFVYVIDDQHLVIPERPGNRRLDSMRNILSNPHIGVLFIIPSLEETLRINGKAYIINDDELLDKMKAHGKKPLLGIGIEVEECYVHCAKAFKRSGIWDSSKWPAKDAMPDISKVIADHANIKGLTSKDVAMALKETYEKRLY